MKRIPLASADIGDLEIQAVVDVMKTKRLALGPKIIEFEEKIAAYANTKHGIAVNSGTSALHLMVKALGIGTGDEVITTPFSFVASANCILFENAKPVFVDIDPNTLNLNVTRIEAAITPNTKAILAVDVFGQAADWDELSILAKKYDLKLIEDSAEAIGAQYKGRQAGSLGEVGVFAFYPNKQMTTGEGGIIVTDDDEIARICRSLLNQGRGESGSWLQHERMGFNYRISDLNCALGIVQLERLDEMLAMRQNVADLYNERLNEIDEVHTPFVATDMKISWFVYVIRLSDKYSREDRDRIQKELRERGIENNNYFSPIHLQPYFRELYGYKAGDFPVTEQISDRTIALPFHNHLPIEDIDYVVSALKELL
jgi:perosamine synthetase